MKTELKKTLTIISLTMSYRQILYQIVFGTKNREFTIADAHSEELYKYVS